MVAFFAAAVGAALILFDPYVILTSILAVVDSRIPTNAIYYNSKNLLASKLHFTKYR